MALLLLSIAVITKLVLPIRKACSKTGILADFINWCIIESLSGCGSSYLFYQDRCHVSPDLH